MLTTCLVYVQYDFEDLPRRIQKLQRQSPSLMSICVKRETEVDTRKKANSAVKEVAVDKELLQVFLTR